MIPVQCPFPPGLVVIVSGDLARYNQFSKSLEGLMVPIGSHWEWMEGTSIAANRNLAVSELRADEKWIFTLDDDHQFTVDILMRLLARMLHEEADQHIDIMQALCSTRKPPYRPWCYMQDPKSTGPEIEYIGASWDELPTTGVSEWDAVGTGGMLIRRKVIDTLPYPWFEVGKTARDAYGEDLYFCYKAKQAGFRIWCDSDNRTTHMTSAVGLEPAVDIDGRWRINADMGHGLKLAVPQEAWAHIPLPLIPVPSRARD